MHRCMIIFAIELTGYGSLRRVAVSLPYVAELVDHVKYLEPEDMPRLEGTELRRQRAARGPSLRTIVQWARECESAEELGRKISRRYRRIETIRRQAETDRLLAAPQD